MWSKVCWLNLGRTVICFPLRAKVVDYALVVRPRVLKFGEFQSVEYPTISKMMSASFACLDSNMGLFLFGLKQGIQCGQGRTQNALQQFAGCRKSTCKPRSTDFRRNS